MSTKHIEGFTVCAIAGFSTLSISFIHFWPAFRLAETCYFDAPSEFNLIYVTYFYNIKRCSHQSLELIFPKRYNLAKYVPYIDFPDCAKYESVTRTFARLEYCIDFIWFITSLLLITGVFKKYYGNKVLLYYAPWLATTFSACIIDMLGMVFFMTHLNVNSFQKWILLVGGSFSNAVDIEDSLEIQALVLSPILNMFFYSSRFIIVFVLNIVLFFKVTRTAKKAFYLS